MDSTQHIILTNATEKHMQNVKCEMMLGKFERLSNRMYFEFLPSVDYEKVLSFICFVYERIKLQYCCCNPCGWTKDKNRIQYALKTVYEQLRLWSEERYFSEYGGFQNWFAMLEERTWDGDKLNQIYEKELVYHKLTKIPVRNIIV